jgi:hypothetical protein
VISGRTKWLLGGATLAPAGLFGVWGLSFYSLRLMQNQQLNPQEVAQRMLPTLPYATILMKLFLVGCLFLVLSLISLAFDNWPKRTPK